MISEFEGCDEMDLCQKAMKYESYASLCELRHQPIQAMMFWDKLGDVYTVLGWHADAADRYKQGMHHEKAEKAQALADELGQRAMYSHD